MKSRFFVSISSLIASTIMLATAPAEANIFYDMEFFNEVGELVGTGEFSHDETPFEGDFEECISVRTPLVSPFPEFQTICNGFSPRFERSQNVFRLNSFSTIFRLKYFPTKAIDFDPRFLLWRPFDVQRVSGISLDGGPTPFDPSLSYRDSSWRTSSRFIFDEMTATTWTASNPAAYRSGTWTATRRSTISIPETTPVVGLLALGGVGLMMVSKRQS